VTELTDAVRTAVDGLPVVVVWLFGSTAGGTQRADSDTDLAVLPDPSVPADQRLALHLALLERLGAAGVLRPDVVLVDQAPLRLQARVSAEGRVLLSRDEPARVAWTSRVFREHADFAVLQDELDRQMLRAHATGAR
jgi:predicted nucleotidyltransferase